LIGDWFGFRVDLELVVVVEREYPASAGNRTSVFHSVTSNFFTEISLVTMIIIITGPEGP
jgi:hypothetical protein